MIIALNTLSARAGGGLSAFINLMPALAEIDKQNQYIVFYSSKNKEISDAIPERFIKVEINHMPSIQYIRVLWEQFIFPAYIFYYKIDVLYSVGNTTSILACCKVVLLIENSNPFSCANIGWTKKEIIRNRFLKYLGWLSAKRANKIRFVSENSGFVIFKPV